MSLRDAIRRGVVNGIRISGFLSSERTIATVEHSVGAHLAKVFSDAIIQATKAGKHDVAAALQWTYIQLTKEPKENEQASDQKRS